MEPGGSPPPVPTPPGSSSAGWVLVCDDTASIRLLIRINLELAGFEVLECTDGRAALDLLNRHRKRLPRVLILDAQMRRLDGWATVAELRADPVFAKLPVLMVTAALQQRERERSVAAGVDAFLPKPFDPDELVSVVRDLAGTGRRPAQP